MSFCICLASADCEHYWPNSAIVIKRRRNCPLGVFKWGTANHQEVFLGSDIKSSEVGAMRYEIEDGMIEIREKSILITKSGTTQSLLILSAEIEAGSRVFVCSDLEEDTIYTIEVGEDGVVAISEGAAARQELIKDYDPSSRTTLNLSIDHSRTIETLAKKTSIVGRKITRLLKWLAIATAIMLVLVLAAAIISNTVYQKRQEAQRAATLQRIRRLTDFVPNNYLGSYGIDYVFRNGKVLVWDPTLINPRTLAVGGAEYVQSNNVGPLFGNRAITGRLDLSPHRIDVMIDYDSNGTFTSNEVSSWVSTVVPRQEYGAGNILYQNGGGAALFLVDDKTARLQFKQGNDEVTYALTRRSNQ